MKEARDDDDTNDFNDISLYDALEKAHAEGRSLNQTDNQTDEARAKGLTRQNGIKNGYGFDDESGGFGYGGYRGKLTSFCPLKFIPLLHSFDSKGMTFSQQ